MFRFVLSAALALTAASGCVASTGDEGRVDAIRGTLGDVSFDGQPEVRELRWNLRELYLDVRVQNDEGHWAMVGITIPRDLGDVDVGNSSLVLEDAEMLGCSGEVEDSWDYDCEPEFLMVDVTESDGKNVWVDFEGEFSATDCLSRDVPPADVPVQGSVEVPLF